MYCSRAYHQMLPSKTPSARIVTYLLAATIGFFVGNLRRSRAQTSAIPIVRKDSSDPTFSMMSAAFAMTAAPTLKVSPIAGITVKDLHDSFNEMHHGHPHEAIDIVEPRGTP